MKKLWKWLLISFIFRLILLPLTYHGDINIHVIWGQYAHDFGLKGYYDYLNFFNYSRPNEPPLTILLCLVMSYFYDFLYQILWWLNIQFPVFPSDIVSWYAQHGYATLLKLPSIIADLLLAVLIYKVAFRLLP